jgi:lactose/cellobiose-specific phosphotransferase system IIC component
MRLSNSPYISIVRDSLTLAFPVIIAGALAVFINNFPLAGYQSFMEGVFGPKWHNFGGYVWGGTLAILAPVTVCTIGYGLARHYNSHNRLDTVHPLIVGLISLCSLMTIIEPSSEVFAIPYQWVGIHGLFLAIIVAVVSSELFLKLYSLKFRVRFFADAPSSTMSDAFASLLPGTITLFAFACFKMTMNSLGFSDVHKLTYDLLCRPFTGMGNNLTTALLFAFFRHFLWFLGIHGSNAMEPVMTEIYDVAAIANEAALAAGTPPPFVFTRAFFDSYISIGGAGNTLSLLAALMFVRRSGGLGRIATLSVVPGLFNINETLMFGLPIVLNPIFFVPFLLVPIALTLSAYFAVGSGLVGMTSAQVTWTTPIFFSGYAAAGGMSGGVLQTVNLVIGAAIYLPFVKIAENIQMTKFEATYKELLRLSSSLHESVGGPTLVNRSDDIGTFSRALANDLLSSIVRSELFLEYQPQVDCRTGRVIGVEALVRWKHKRLGRVPPSLFIPLAEEIGFIDELGLWVCDECCRQMKEWSEEGIEGVVMSFNVSVKQLDNAELPEDIALLFEKWDVPPSMMKMEVTESTGLSSDMGHNILLQDIKLMGLNIAIDDFGMGHTSLVYLKQFPVSTIKLDGSLVRDVTTNKISAEIITTISELCRSMGIQLLAEFVETQAHAETLKKLGCYLFQGYLYSPALSPDKCAMAIRGGFGTY